MAKAVGLPQTATASLLRYARRSPTLLGRRDPSEGRRASHEQDRGGETVRKLEFQQAVHGTSGDSRSEPSARICRARNRVR